MTLSSLQWLGTCQTLGKYYMCFGKVPRICQKKRLNTIKEILVFCYAKRILNIGWVLNSYCVAKYFSLISVDSFGLNISHQKQFLDIKTKHFRSSEMPNFRLSSDKNVNTLVGA